MRLRVKPGLRLRHRFAVDNPVFVVICANARDLLCRDGSRL